MHLALGREAGGDPVARALVEAADALGPGVAEGLVGHKVKILGPVARIDIDHPVLGQPVHTILDRIADRAVFQLPAVALPEKIPVERAANAQTIVAHLLGELLSRRTFLMAGSPNLDVKIAAAQCLLSKETTSEIVPTRGLTSF